MDDASASTIQSPTALTPQRRVNTWDTVVQAAVTATATATVATRTVIATATVITT